MLVQNILAHVTKPYEHIKIITSVPQQNNMILVDTINQISVTKKN